MSIKYIFFYILILSPNIHYAKALEAKPSSQEILLLNEFALTNNELRLNEISHYSFLRNEEKIYGMQIPREYVEHQNLGRINRPSSHIRHIERTKKKIIYNATYSFDQFSRRYNPMGDYKNKKQFLIFFGCSFTYGNGLNDNQTVTHFINQNSKIFQAYNYAIGATGPNTMLALLEQSNFKKEIPQSKGHFVYIYIASHIQRANGFMQELAWLGNSPYYKLTKNRLIRDGSFETATPIRTAFFAFLRDKLSIHTLLNRNFPKISNYHIRLTCKIIAHSRDVFNKIYSDAKFMVVVHPLASMDQSLQGCLLKHNINLFMPKPSIDMLQNHDKYVIPHDGHPNELTNKYLANEILSQFE